MTKSASWVSCIALMSVLIGRRSCQSIPYCFLPTKIAYDVQEPMGGANETLSPIIFLHGISASKEYWLETPKIIADKTQRRVFNLDARNHGDSEWSEAFNFDLNAQDLVHFMDSKSISKAILIGHSMGGISAIKVALAHPQRVELVFVEDMSTRRVPRASQQHVSRLLELMAGAVSQLPADLDGPAANHRLLTELMGREEVDLALGKGRRRTNMKRTFAIKRGDDGRYALKANTRVLVNALRTEEATMSANKGVYSGPAYFIYGTESAFKVGDEVDHIRQHFPNAQLIPVEGVNHEVQLSVPKEYIEAVVNAIRSNEGTQIQANSTLMS